MSVEISTRLGTFISLIMAHFSTKHTPQFRPIPEVDTVTGRNGTLMDDMTVNRFVCIPQVMRPPADSSIVFGDEPRNYSSLVRESFPPQPYCRNPDETKARAADMNTRHWGFDGPFDAGPRGPAIPLEAYRRQNANGPRATEASITRTPEDDAVWRGDLVSEMKRKYLKPGAPRADANGKIAADANASHFSFGDAAPDYWRKEHVGATEVPVRAVNENLRSSVPIHGPGRVPPSESQAAYGPKYVTPERKAKEAAATNVVLGEDPRETKTEHRSAYKVPKFTDCGDLTEQELTALGLVRFRFSDVPDQYKDTVEYKQAKEEVESVPLVWICVDVRVFPYRLSYITSHQGHLGEISQRQTAWQLQSCLTSRLEDLNNYTHLRPLFSLSMFFPRIPCSIAQTLNAGLPVHCEVLVSSRTHGLS